MNFVEHIPAEAAVHVFSFLPLRDLAACISVSRQWREVANDSLVWKNLCARLQPNLAVKALERSDWREIARCVVEKQYSEPKYNLAARGVRSSSQDGNQSIRFTLTPMYFWSSAPHPDKDSDEFLDYELASVGSVVREVAITAMESERVYAPRGLRVLLSTSEEFEEGCTWTSPTYRVENVSERQCFSLFDPLQPLLEAEASADPVEGVRASAGHGAGGEKTARPESGEAVGVSGGRRQSDGEGVRGEPFLAAFARLELVGKYEPHFVPGLQDRFYTCITAVEISGAFISCCNEKFARASLNFHWGAFPGSVLSGRMDAKVHEASASASSSTSSEHASHAGTSGHHAPESSAEASGVLLSSSDGLVRRLKPRCESEPRAKRARVQTQKQKMAAVEEVLAELTEEENGNMQESEYTPSQELHMQLSLLELLMGRRVQFG